MKKLLILSNSVLRYRIPLFNLLNRQYDLTVTYFNEYEDPEKCNFNVVKLHKTKIGKIVFVKENICQLAKLFDIVIFTGDLHYFSYWSLIFSRRSYSLISWGTDVSFSYSKGYDEDKRLDFARFFLAKKVDACIFYCDYPVNRYVTDGKIERNKLFVANNTIEISNDISVGNVKHSFIFIGTLYQEKKIFDLLFAYKRAFDLDNSIGKLIIVGDGPERDQIVDYINSNGLDNNVTLMGPIYDNNELLPLFMDSIACISPGQAGLSVLKSLAFGVPFITTSNAITGGERFNIINNYNGFLYDGSIDMLATLIILLSNSPEYVQKISRNARSYYIENASITKMKDSFVDAIEYASCHKRKCQRSFK